MRNIVVNGYVFGLDDPDGCPVFQMAYTDILKRQSLDQYLISLYNEDFITSLAVDYRLINTYER